MADPNLFFEFLINKSKTKPGLDLKGNLKSDAVLDVPEVRQSAYLQRSSLQEICQFFEQECKMNDTVIRNVDAFSDFMHSHMPRLLAKFEKLHTKKVD